jgi:pyroglutamyl-peptidase
MIKIKLFKQFFMGLCMISSLNAQDFSHVQLSGFEPFQQRSQNASWVLVTQLGLHYPKIKTIQVPVVWDQPKEILVSTLKNQGDIKVWIAFGEGSKTFQIEMKADNMRRDSEDNLKQKPKNTQIKVDGVMERRLGVDVGVLNQVVDALVKKGFETKLSQEAGNYLCEEMLYQLLDMQSQEKRLNQVFFVHVPILGSEIESNGKMIKVDEGFLKAFGIALIEVLKHNGLI